MIATTHHWRHLVIFELLHLSHQDHQPSMCTPRWPGVQAPFAALALACAHALDRPNADSPPGRPSKDVSGACDFSVCRSCLYFNGARVCALRGGCEARSVAGSGEA